MSIHFLKNSKIKNGREKMKYLIFRVRSSVAKNSSCITISVFYSRLYARTVVVKWGVGGVVTYAHTSRLARRPLLIQWFTSCEHNNTTWIYHCQM